MDKNIFKNPPKEYRASPFWSWTGSLKPTEIKRQIREMKKQGYGGYFMHAREGLETKYLGEEWFDEYWMNHGVTTRMKKGKATPIRSIKDFLEFKRGDKSKIVPMNTKKKIRTDEAECD